MEYHGCLLFQFQELRGQEATCPAADVELDHLKSTGSKSPIAFSTKPGAVSCLFIHVWNSCRAETARWPRLQEAEAPDLQSEQGSPIDRVPRWSNTKRWKTVRIHPGDLQTVLAGPTRISSVTWYLCSSYYGTLTATGTHSLTPDYFTGCNGGGGGGDHRQPC